MEMPELNKLVEKYKDSDVEFLAIALDNPSQLKSFLKKTDFDYRVLSISQKDVAPLNITGYPTHLILNRDGQIVFKSMGYSPGSIEALENPAFDFVVYPVPLTSSCTIKLTSLDFQPVEIQLFDAQGVLIKQQRTLANAGENHLVLDELNLSSGTYLVLVKLGNSIAYQTVVK